ncbi:MAG: FAD-binding oxidoreductase [Candidatus Heimdallarchaeota archaeon]
MKKKAFNAFKNQFDDKIAFDKAIRILYSRDVGELPRLVSMAIKNVPDAVFLPQNESDIVNLYQIASQYKIPVIPRGAGSSGYGGALAYRGGVMVDLTAIREVEKASKSSMTVTVGAGITFANLEAFLSSKGQALKSYPSSAPSATLGGWFAQGGSGIGSLKYGLFRDQVVSLRLVRPDGEVLEISGDEVGHHYELEGTTGIITSVTLNTKQTTPITPILGTFDSAGQLSDAIHTSLQETTPFTIIAGTPTFVHLRQLATGDFILPDNKYFGLFVIEGSEEGLSPFLSESIEKCGGSVEGSEEAAHEWKERFYPLRLKRLGPGLIIGESYIPIKHLTAYLAAVDQKFGSNESSSEVTVVSKKEAAVLTYFLNDNRRRSEKLGFAWSKTFQILKIAEKFGGRPYSTGLWLSGKARSYFGREKLQEIKEFRNSSDPSHIANPGKICDGKVRILPFLSISAAMKMAMPLMRLGNAIFRFKRKKTHPPPTWHGRKTLG